jgi:hypothetical protein
MSGFIRPARRIVAAVLVTGIALSDGAFAQVGPGDDAVVLPKGYFRLMFDGQFFIPFTNRYNDNGDSVPMGQPYSVPLNSVTFPALAPLNAFAGGNATLGNSQVDIKRHLQQYLFQPAYGLTDRLTIGMNIQYVSVRNQVTANVDSSAATVGFTTVASPFGPAGSIAPIALVPGTRRATTQDIQNLLRTQFGLSPVQTFNADGIGDIEIGGRYQYYRGEYVRAAFTGGARIPTCRTDDPNNLVDVGWGTGAYALLSHFNFDLMFQKDGLGKRLGFPAPGELLINTTVRYEYNLPNTQQARVCNPNLICNNIDNDTKRKLGDVIAVDVSAKVGMLFDGLIFVPRYFYQYKFKDAYSGDNPNFTYGDLAIDTQSTQHLYFLSLVYSTVPIVGQGKFWFPASFSVTFRDRFAGTNVVDSRYIGFNAQFFF